jgi:LysR family transcriptional regulator, cys regulon transcriptional activator
MKLQQLRYLVAVAQTNLHVTAAAAKLHASQPALSKQLKLLEEELGFRIFVRSGRTLVRLTPPGERVLACAVRLLREAQNIRGISEEYQDADQGELSIGTTHTQARYVLPAVIQRFREKYPDVNFHLHQGTSEQIAEMAELDTIDIAIATGSHELFASYVRLPCYHWRYRIIVPRAHPLAHMRSPGLEELCAHPLITYEHSLTGPSSLSEAFQDSDLAASVTLTAQDSDVIKTYVRLGLGVGIIADVAIDRLNDPDLVSIEAGHLFPAQTTWIGFAREGLIRGYMYDFLHLMAPHLTRGLVDQALECATPEDVENLFRSVRMP